MGTGVYLNNVNASIEHRKDQLLSESRNEFGLILILSVLATLVCIFISVLVSRRISLRFDQMEQRISDDFNRIQNSRRRLQHMARHDSLTALPNRSELEVQVNRAIAHSKLEGKLVALVFVDLDNFKRINDQYGHSSGDELLKQIGSRFERILGTNDIVSRFGGMSLSSVCREFTILWKRNRKSNKSKMYSNRYLIFRVLQSLPSVRLACRCILMTGLR